MIAKRHLVVTLIGLGVAAGATFAFFKPRPTQLVMTTCPGDDTVIINQFKLTRLNGFVLDQRGRRLVADTAVRYEWLSGDSIQLSPGGRLQCDAKRNAMVRATYATFEKTFTLRCRPVKWIEAIAWLDLLAGDSARNLSFAVHGPDGHPVTELRGTITVSNKSIVAIEGTSVRPLQAGAAVAIIDVGDVQARVPIMVYQPVTSFVGNPRGLGLMAIPVSLAQGDTIEAPVPKSSFWATYFSREAGVAPPTIELVGDGGCATGDGINARRMTDDEYAKYCHAEDGARLKIAHGATGAARVNGVVALRIMW